MDKGWPNVLQRITATGAFDVFGSDAKGKGKGPNHVRSSGPRFGAERADPDLLLFQCLVNE